MSHSYVPIDPLAKNLHQILLLVPTRIENQIEAAPQPQPLDHILDDRQQFIQVALPIIGNRSGEPNEFPVPDTQLQPVYFTTS